MSLGEIVARRRKSAETTRAKMLESARAHFLRESYENVGLRDIARDVGVDVALVSRYFGSKEELFREVLHGDGDKADKFRIAVSVEELPDYLVSLFQGTDCEDTRKHTENLLIALRSASSPQAAVIVHDAIRNDVLDPIARILGGGEDAEMQAGMILSIMLGSTVMRTIMSVEPACAAGPPPEILVRLRALFETALAPIPAAQVAEYAEFVQEAALPVA